MTHTEAEANEDQQLAVLLESGSEIAGGVAGAAISLFVGGPVGTFLGAAAQPLLVRGLRNCAVEAIHRQLSRREQTRVAAVVSFAAVRIQRKIGLGYEPRHDGFFQGEPGNRSAAEELAEGALLAAQREHEERKLRYMGNLVASFAFESAISRSNANLLLQHADSLSYRQLCLLALVGRKAEFPQLRQGTFEGLSPDDLAAANYLELVGILEEAEELINAQILDQRVRIIFGSGEGFNPGEAQLYRWGAALYEMMGLDELPTTELQPLADRLT